MTNDKTSPHSGTEYGQDVYQRSLSENEYYSPRAKRPHYDNLAETMYETKKYHRLIEKRRRDRINKCIYQLRLMLPADVLKSTSKPMEKAVVLDLVVKHMRNITQKNEGGRSAEYVRGFQDCTNHAIKFLKQDQSQEKISELSQHLQKEMVVSESVENMNEDNAMFLPPLSNSDTASTSNTEESSGDKPSVSSSSLSPGSPASDFSQCADNSDSSAGQEMVSDHKVAKRKVYSHHHKSQANSNQVKKQQTSTTPTSNQNQAPVFINMPFMMTPNMMPTTQFLSPDGTPMMAEAQMPRMVQSFPMSQPGGMMMPQMNTDNNNMQFPTYFMSCGGAQQRTEHRHHQTQTSEQGVMFQPMMMPMRSQGNFMMMPSYPCMPSFQTPTLVPVQTSTEEQTSPSE